jgi:hypothetical protein
MPVIPALERLRQEDLEFKASLGYIGRPCLKNKKEKIASKPSLTGENQSGEKEYRTKCRILSSLQNFGWWLFFSSLPFCVSHFLPGTTIFCL